MTRWLLPLVLILIAASPSYAGDGPDVKDWLSRPGVKLLAVEFYASWCAPCKKAVPRWKALHETYRDRGLRLVVVSVQDPDGACVNPGWNPDDVVCDAEGHLAEAWGLGNRLPAAFLWSWRGPILVRKGHVDEVERAVEEELKHLPRVTLDEGMDAGVHDLLRTELARTGKVDVVAGTKEEEALARIRRRSYEVQFSEPSACDLGQRLAANSLLKVSFVAAGGGKRLLVQLFSAETGCLSASAGVFWNLERPELSVAEAVTELVNNLRVPVEQPGQAMPATVAERDIGEREDSWTIEDTSGVIVAFETEPIGAVVLLDGKVLCQSAPCSRLVAPGMHKVEFQLESFLAVRENVTVNNQMKNVKRTMTPDFGWLTVVSEPSNLPVNLDGKPWGTTPVARRQLPSGPHRVMVSADRYFDKGKEIVVERGAHEKIEVKLARREGGIQVHARDGRGNDLQARVLVDGIEVGHSPFTGKLLIGNHIVEVMLRGESWNKTITVQEKQVEELDAVLDIEAEADTTPDEPGSEETERQLIHVGVSMAEGMVFAGDSMGRSGVSAAFSTWLKWGWFRWEPLFLGVSFEGANAMTVGTGATWDIASGLYLRTLFNVASADGSTYWGLLAGAGYGFYLGGGWRLDAEADATVWPGEAILVPIVGRLGVRYGF